MINEWMNEYPKSPRDKKIIQKELKENEKLTLDTVTASTAPSTDFASFKSTSTFNTIT